MKALITGASSGLGTSFAHYLSNLGYDLILVARREEKLTELKKNLNTDIEIIPLDLSIEENNYKLYERVKDKNIDLLINNAGFGLFGNFYETSLDREIEMINLNIKSLHILTKLFLKDFVKKDKGCILNVASSAAFLAGPKLSTYYATKNYVCRLSEAIYEELRRKKSNVHISVLCPGPIDTEFNKVAKVHFNTSSLKPDDVAKYTIKKALKNKLIIIPSLKMKLGVFATRLLPRKFLYKITYNIQDKKMK